MLDPWALVRADEMRGLEARTIDLGTPSSVLMERAGAGIVAELDARCAAALRHGVVVLAGPGNNGGDGFVVARLFREGGLRVRVLLVAPESRVTGDARVALRRWRRAGGRIEVVAGPEQGRVVDQALAGCGLVLDALFGTGLARPLDGAAAWLVDRVAGAIARREAPPVCVAVDLPSGLAADSGEPLGRVLPADLTLTLGAVKIGLVLPAGRRLAGEVVRVEIGLAAEALSAASDLPTWSCAAALSGVLPRHGEASHKGSHGHVLIVGGAPGRSGAAVLAARAALRGGAGLVSVACPRESGPIVAASGPEWMTETWQGFSPTEWRARLERYDALVVGPGLGTTSEAARLVRWLVRSFAGPLVLDADALNVLAPLRQPFRRADNVLTPHPGEMARLCGLEVAAVQADRTGLARRMAREWQATVVLKGAATVVAEPRGHVAVNGSGGPLLAVGGTGDVLAGLIGALRGQGIDAFAAARVGAWLHGRAADRLAGRLGDRGLLASELADELPLAFAEIVPPVAGRKQ